MIKQQSLLYQFMTETQFHGFNMLVNSKSIYEIVIWLFMLLLCTFFTVYQTISLISLYRSEPTMSVITVNQRGTFTSRDTQICFTWDMETDTLITELSAIDYLLSNVTNFTISQLQTERVNPNLFEPQLFRLILAMLFDITMHEAHTFGFQRSLVGKPIWGFTKYKSDYQLNSALYRVHQFFAEKKVSLKELMSATSSIACQIMQAKAEMIYFYTKSGGFEKFDLDICRVANFGYMNDLGFCLLADRTNQLINFRTSFDFLAIASNPNQLDSFFNQTERKGSVLIDLLGKKFSQQTGVMIMSNYLKHTSTTVEIHGIYQAYSAQKRPCFKNKNEAVKCRDYCWANAIAKLCHCWPLYFAFVEPREFRLCVDHMGPVQNSTPYYIPDYNECLVGKNYTTYDCEASCMSDCEHVKMTFVTELIDGTARQNTCPFQYHDRSTLVQIKFGSFSYPRIDEVLAKSFESFMAEFGGLMGLWLGGSLLALTHVFIFIVRIARESCKGLKPSHPSEL